MTPSTPCNWTSSPPASTSATYSSLAIRFSSRRRATSRRTSCSRERRRALPFSYFPKDGYRGEYVKGIAAPNPRRPLHADAPEDETSAFFRSATLNRIIASQRAALEALACISTRGLESSLYGLLARWIRPLRFCVNAAITYEKDGALWFKSSRIGRRQRTAYLIRSNEKATYVAADVSLPRRQVSARMRSPHRSVRRRPSRLCRAPEGRYRGQSGYNLSYDLKSS